MIKKDWLFSTIGSGNCYKCPCCKNITLIPTPFCSQCGEPLTDKGRKIAADRASARSIAQLDEEFNDVRRQLEEWDAINS